MPVWKSDPTYFTTLQNNLRKPEFYQGQEDEHPIPLEVEEFLGKLSLLCGIPFHYLVPDEKMLPPESIRFFYVDQNWLTSLRDGAAGIGRAGSTEMAHDISVLPSLQQAARRAAHQVRKNMLAAHTSAEEVSGFLLRSSAVGGWPGLKVEGYLSQADCLAHKPQLTILRMERLSENVLLCLFSGKLGYVEIYEPAEAIHFGMPMPAPESPAGTVPCKELCYLVSDSQHEIGEKTGETVNVPFRKNGRQVIKVKELARTMQDNLKVKVFTAAEFALEMMEGAQKVGFKILGG